MTSGKAVFNGAGVSANGSNSRAVEWGGGRSLGSWVLVVLWCVVGVLHEVVWDFLVATAQVVAASVPRATS